MALKTNKSHFMGVCLILIAAAALHGAEAEGEGIAPPEDKSLLADLKDYKCKIVYETFQDGNWELFMIDADGGHPVNLTRTPKLNELYPKVSPDGTKIAFVCDEGDGRAKVRSVCYMNMDGTNRTVIAKNARQPCWSADGSTIAYLHGETEEFTYTDFATKGIAFYDLKAGKHTEHPNEGIHHLYNICWSPDGNWILATVHAGMGFKHAIVAIEVHGMRVVNLEIPGCRPDISPDGKKIAWGAGDYLIRVADLDLSSPTPKVINQRAILLSIKPLKIYHVDWSPDSRYVTFSRGPKEKKSLNALAAEMVGSKADGWNICVADPTKLNRWVAVTSDGKSDKEPDWTPAGKK